MSLELMLATRVSSKLMLLIDLYCIPIHSSIMGNVLTDVYLSSIDPVMTICQLCCSQSILLNRKLFFLIKLGFLCYAEQNKSVAQISHKFFSLSIFSIDLYYKNLTNSSLL